MTRSRPPFVIGLLIALVAAVTFGSSGAFGAALMETGWSPGAVVTARICGAAALLAVPALVALRGRWGLLRHNLGRVLAYGIFAVAVCQLAYFVAVDHLSVGVALLLEYQAPVLIVGWLWLRHGRRPNGLTTAGVVAAVTGLVLVLDITSQATFDVVGVLFGLVAAVGLVVYFLAAEPDGQGESLPPITLAGGGLAVGALALALAGASGLLPMAASGERVDLAGWSVPWWGAVLELALVAGAIAYASGIAATRALGSTVASFVGLSEVLCAIGIAWVLVGEAMTPVQMVGGVVILAGIVAVKLGEGGDAAGGAPLPADDVDAVVLEDGFGDPERVH